MKSAKEVFLNEKNHSGDLQQVKESIGDGTGITAHLSIGGMTCLSCARRIEEGLKKSSGVLEAEVEFARKRAEILYEPGRIDLSGLKASVDALGYSVLQKENEIDEKQEFPSLSDLLSSPRPYLIGLAVSFGVIGFYLGLLTLTSDWYNARAEFKEYGWWLGALALGLGVQALLFTFLRAWHRGRGMKAAKCSLAASGGISTTAMAACCSHYLATLLPVIGIPFLSSFTAGLAEYQTYFFLIGVLSNLFGISLMLRMMSRSGVLRMEAIMNHLTFGYLPAKR